MAAHDCGRAINRTQVEGQMHGCVSMGLGQVLMEAGRFGPPHLSAIVVRSVPPFSDTTVSSASAPGPVAFTIQDAVLRFT